MEDLCNTSFTYRYWLYRSSGDWPDWWSDGVASTAQHTKVFRNAQRSLRLLELLMTENDVVSTSELTDINNELVMDAEHTWGHSHSVLEPWNSMVNELNVRKGAYAANSSRLINETLDIFYVSRGDQLLSPGKSMRFKVLNPFSKNTKSVARLPLDVWEQPLVKSGLQVIEEKSGQILEYQIKPVIRGIEIEIPVDLQAKEEKHYQIKPNETSNNLSVDNISLITADGIKDVACHSINKTPDGIRISETSIESPYVNIKWSNQGITSWLDKRTGKDLIKKESDYPAFSPIYERSPA